MSLFTDLLEADCRYDDDDDLFLSSSSSESDTSLPELSRLRYRFRGGDDCFLLLQKKGLRQIEQMMPLTMFALEKPHKKEIP